jgi:DNA (cytosine-5)-methyltransferase 1
LENVKQLRTHDHGKTFARIQEVIHELGYSFDSRILNTMDFGLPHKRERVLMIGFAKPVEFAFPVGTGPMLPLSAILEPSVGPEHFASAKVQEQRRVRHPNPSCSPAIWHENKQGNVSSHPYSCALRANGSYNYLLVDGIRRLTPREMLRLQGFPESFQAVCSNSQTRKQAGNAVSVPVIAAVLRQVQDAMTAGRESKRTSDHDTNRGVWSEPCSVSRDSLFPQL